MPRGARIALFALAAIVALAAGFYFGLARLQAPEPPPGAKAALAAASFEALDGTRTSLAPWKGQVIVLNFWATWCPPCREEIPDLMRIQREFAAKGVQVVGIALDSMENTRQFAGEFNVNYPLVVGGSAGLDLARDVGNRAGALPFTIVIDKQGNIVKSHLGILRLDDLRAILTPLVS